MDCELLLIGNELLIGKIRDTNGQWIIEQLLPMGVKISRITIIPDVVLVITSAVQESISRSPAYLFISGGLGPTHDDMTLEGLTLGLNPPQPIELNNQAMNLILDRYRKRYADIPLEKLMTPSRKKMAHLPKGTLPLLNREGTAPGVYVPKELTNGTTKIISLPGVPAELKAIFLDHLLPEIKGLVGDGKFTQCGFTFQVIGESKFTEKINSIKDQYPEIWIKTHPKSRPKLEVELHLTSYSTDPALPGKMIELYGILLAHAKNSGGVVVKESPLAPSQ